MGTMSILDKTGDTRYSWDPGNTDEVAAAKAVFAGHIEQGFSAFAVTGDWRQSERINDFLEGAERIIFVPPMKGG